MAALAQDRLIRKYYQSAGPVAQRRPYASSSNFAASKTAYVGALMMAVAGVAEPLLSGAGLVAKCTTIAGADANGGVVLRSRQPNVTVQFAGGLTKTLAVTSITYGATTAILIQQGTDGAGAVTNTAEQMCNLIRGNGELNKLLACEATGTGAGLTATAAATAIAHLEVLGVSPERLETVISGAAMTLRPSIAFDVGPYGMLAVSASEPTKTGSYVSLVNDNEISVATDGLDFHAPLIAIENALYFVDLAQAR